MPDAVDAIAGHVASLLILGPEVKRLALESPLFFAIIAQHNAVIAAGAVAIHHKEWRPVGGAWAIANALAATGGILVKGVQRHAVAASEHAIGGHGRRGGFHIRSRTGSHGGGYEKCENEFVGFHDFLRWCLGRYTYINGDRTGFIPNCATNFGLCKRGLNGCQESFGQ